MCRLPRGAAAAAAQRKRGCRAHTRTGSRELGRSWLGEHWGAAARQGPSVSPVTRPQANFKKTAAGEDGRPIAKEKERATWGVASGPTAATGVREEESVLADTRHTGCRRCRQDRRKDEGGRVDGLLMCQAEPRKGDGNRVSVTRRDGRMGYRQDRGGSWAKTGALCRVAAR